MRCVVSGVFVMAAAGVGKAVGPVRWAERHASAAQVG